MPMIGGGHGSSVSMSSNPPMNPNTGSNSIILPNSSLVSGAGNMYGQSGGRNQYSSQQRMGSSQSYNPIGISAR